MIENKTLRTISAGAFSKPQKCKPYYNHHNAEYRNDGTTTTTLLTRWAGGGHFPLVLDDDFCVVLLSCSNDLGQIRTKTVFVVFLHSFIDATPLKPGDAYRPAVKPCSDPPTPPPTPSESGIFNLRERVWPLKQHTQTRERKHKRVPDAPA